MGPNKNNHFTEGCCASHHGLISKWGKTVKHSIGLGDHGKNHLTLRKHRSVILVLSYLLSCVIFIKPRKKRQVLLKSLLQIRKLRHRGLLDFLQVTQVAKAEQALSPSSPNQLTRRAKCCTTSLTALGLTFTADPGMLKGRKTTRCSKIPGGIHPGFGGSL